MKKREVDLGSPKTLHNVLLLMIPAMVSQLIVVLYNIIDRIYIGNLPENGELSLVGAGVCAPLTSLTTSFAFFIVLGACPLFSMSLGQHREDDAKKIYANAFLLLIILSAVVMGLFYALLRPMLYWFGASDASFPYAWDYMIWFLPCLPFAFLGTGMNQFLIAQGKSLPSMISNILSSVMNIILDPIFMFTLKMGIKGAAIATTISWAAYALCALLFVLFSGGVKPSFGNYSWTIMRKIMKLGLSPFIILSTDSLIVIGLNIALQQSGVNGDFYIECSTIVQAFFSLVCGPLLGISTGTQTILAYLFGARKMDLLKKAELQITICGLIFTTTCFVLSFFLAEPFADLFVRFSPSAGEEQAKVVEYAAKYIHWYMVPVIILTFQYVQVDGLTGMGQAKYSIWLSVNRKFFLLLPLTFLLPFLSKNPEMAFLAEPIADAVSGIVSLIVFLILFPKIMKKQENSTGSALENA